MPGFQTHLCKIGLMAFLQTYGAPQTCVANLCRDCAPPVNKWVQAGLARSGLRCALLVPPPRLLCRVRTVPPTKYRFRPPTFWSERARRRRRYFLTRFNSVNELSGASCVQRRKNQAKRMHRQKVMVDRNCSLNRLRKKCYGIDKRGTTYAWACEVPTQVGDTSLRGPVAPKVAGPPVFGVRV